jgi:hypothetical protein
MNCISPTPSGSHDTDVLMTSPSGDESLIPKEQDACSLDLYDVGSIIMNMCRTITPITLSEDLIRQICSGGGPLILDELSVTPFSYVPLANLAANLNFKLPAQKGVFDSIWCVSIHATRCILGHSLFSGVW